MGYYFFLVNLFLPSLVSRFFDFHTGLISVYIADFLGIVLGGRDILALLVPQHSSIGSGALAQLDKFHINY